MNFETWKDFLGSKLKRSQKNQWTTQMYHIYFLFHEEWFNFEINLTFEILSPSGYSDEKLFKAWNQIK
jgi:hypothetical protein